MSSNESLDTRVPRSPIHNHQKMVMTQMPIKGVMGQSEWESVHTTEYYLAIKMNETLDEALS